MSSHRDLVHGNLGDVSENVALDALNQRFALAQQSDFADDVDVLNYALTLEYLEAAFYQQGNEAGLVSGKEKEYLELVQRDEEAHVKAVKQTIRKLGGKPVAKPEVQFGDAFANRKSYLTTSHTFENIGVGAYLGAAGFLKNKDVLQAAAGIFGVEARHAALVGNMLGLDAEGGVYKGAFETPLAKSKVLDKIAPYVMPTGGMDTGGGSTEGVEHPGLLAAGGAAVLGAGAAAYAARRRTAEPDD